LAEPGSDASRKGRRHLPRRCGFRPAECKIAQADDPPHQPVEPAYPHQRLVADTKNAIAGENRSDLRDEEQGDPLHWMADSAPVDREQFRGLQNDERRRQQGEHGIGRQAQDQRCELLEQLEPAEPADRRTKQREEELVERSIDDDADRHDHARDRAEGGEPESMLSGWGGSVGHS
jgi:hypothetical protein